MDHVIPKASHLSILPKLSHILNCWLVSNCALREGGNILLLVIEGT